MAEVDVEEMIFGSGSLTQDTPGENDYTLAEDENSCWVTVDDLSVYIVRTDEGVSVDIFPAGKECEDSIAGTWALFQESEDEDEHRD